MTFGHISYDLAHLLGGGVLLLSFVLLYQRRVPAMISAFAAQGAVLAAAAAWQGIVQGVPGLFVTALIAFGAKAVLIPLALRMLLDRLGLARSVDEAFGIGPSLLAAIALVGLSVMVAMPGAAGPAQLLAREDLALALSVVLLGMLMMITRRGAVGQVVGLLSLENGLVLAAIGVRGMPLVVELSTAALVLMLAVVGGVFLLQLRRHVATLDTSHLDAHRGEGL